MSSWGSRFGWGSSGGRWSPFGSRGGQEVTDQDFSYITPADLDRHNSSRNGPPYPNEAPYPQSTLMPVPQPYDTRPRSRSRPSRQDGGRAARETDVIVIRHRKMNYPVHFAAYSVDDGDLLVGHVREAAARRLEVENPNRVRMFYKGKNLKDDEATIRGLGLRGERQEEILCVIGKERLESGLDEEPQRRYQYSDKNATNEGSEDDEEGADSDGEGSDEDHRGNHGAATDVRTPGRKKKSKSGRKKTKRKNSSKSAMGAPPPPPPAGHSAYSSSAIPTVEHLPMPTGAHPRERVMSANGVPTLGTSQSSPAQSMRQSRTSSPAPANTPLGKVEAIADHFYTTLLPQIESFTKSPPSEESKRTYERKRLEETTMVQVILKLDAVEVEGDEARSRRKELVKEVQSYLRQVDQVGEAGRS